jgi:hypothetical protein
MGDSFSTKKMILGVQYFPKKVRVLANISYIGLLQEMILFDIFTDVVAITERELGLHLVPK